jgi:hypothetical protein
MHDDELIDRAAHAMTRGEPSARLRVAVRARLAAGLGGAGLAARRPEPWRRWKQARHLWIPALASAAALVVLAMTLVWMPRPEHRVASSAPAVVAPPRSVVSRVEPPVVESPVTAAAAPQARRQRVTSTAQRIAVIDPLVIEPISVPLMAVDANSGAMPMDIQPLQIEPLQPQ